MNIIFEIINKILQAFFSAIPCRIFIDALESIYFFHLFFLFFFCSILIHKILFTVCLCKINIALFF